MTAHKVEIPCKGCIILPMCMNKTKNRLSKTIYECSLLTNYVFPEYNRRYENESPHLDSFRLQLVKKFFNYKGGIF